VTDDAKDLLARALMLDPKDRAELAARLVDSVHAIAEAEQAWTRVVAERARAAQLGHGWHVHYLGPAPVPVRFDVEAEVDLERAISLLGEDPRRTAAFLSVLTDALERIRGAPSSFGGFPEIAEELGVRRYLMTDLPFIVAFVAMSKEVRVLALVHRYRPPGEGEISLPSLVTTEEWLSASGLRALSALVSVGVGVTALTA
jgi:plasmid stabilization system protein ParE